MIDSHRALTVGTAACSAVAQGFDIPDTPETLRVSCALATASRRRVGLRSFPRRPSSGSSCLILRRLTVL